MNLNAMHGRNSRSSVFPVLFPRSVIEANLRKIAGLFHEYRPDTVTLQEVDNTSIATGGIDQARFLAGLGGYPYFFHGAHTEARWRGRNLFVTGNAILSRHPLERTENFKFDRSFPVPRKGFALADAVLPGSRRITIASVHLVRLDYLRWQPRMRQVRLIRQELQGRTYPQIVAGDFNCGMRSRERTLPYFTEAAGLTGFDFGNDGLCTHPSWKPRDRIDWVLSSPELSFAGYETLATPVSDHRAVIADLTLS